MQELKNPEAAVAAHTLVKAILFYGGMTFLAGFALGVLRELVFLPMAGRRYAHWLEFPLMLVATAFIAHRAAGGLKNHARRQLLALGIAATIVLLLIESVFALYVLKVPLEKYLAGFDIRNGALFPLGLVFMAIAPWVAHRYWMKQS